MREIVRLSHTEILKTQKSVLTCGCSSVIPSKGTFMYSRRKNSKGRR